MDNVREFRRKFVVLGIASVLISLYFIAFAVLLHLYAVVEGFTERWLWISIIPEIAITGVIVILWGLGSQDDNFEIGQWEIKISERIRSNMLIFASFSLIILMAYPCFMLGGAVASGLGTALVTMCSLAIIVTSSSNVRWAILALCLSSYVTSTWVVSYGYLPEFKVVRPLFHQNLQIALVILSLFVTLILSWKGEFTIFTKSKTRDQEPTGI